MNPKSTRNPGFFQTPKQFPDLGHDAPEIAAADFHLTSRHASNFHRWRDRAEMLLPPLPWDRPHWRDRGGQTGGPAARPVARLACHGAADPGPGRGRGSPPSISPIRPPACRFRNSSNSSAPRWKKSPATNPCISSPTRSEAFSPGRCSRMPRHGNPDDWSCWHRRMAAARSSTGPASHPVIHQFLGPAGRALGSEGFPSSLPPLPDGLEAAVIMGSRCSIPIVQEPARRRQRRHRFRLKRQESTACADSR